MDPSTIDTAKTRMQEARKQVTITRQALQDEPRIEAILGDVRDDINLALTLLNGAVETGVPSENDEPAAASGPPPSATVDGTELEGDGGER